jgi:hypothetical protein
MQSEEIDATAESSQMHHKEGQSHARASGGDGKRPSPSLIPVVKLGEERTYSPWEFVPCPKVVVKVQDLVSNDGKTNSSCCDRVASAGGLHEFLSCPGEIILSSIMPDETILGFTWQRYLRLIEELEPDYYLTPDGETYLGEPHLSGYEISRMLKETKFLIDAGLNSEPIGLVKGSNVAQVRRHAEALMELGIHRLAFHASGFLDHGTTYSIAQAGVFSAEIRKVAPWLMIYGCGSKEYFRRYRFADSFVTHRHFLDAFNGLKWHHGRKSPSRRLRSREATMANLSDMCKCIRQHDENANIDEWIGDGTRSLSPSRNRSRGG